MYFAIFISLFIVQRLSELWIAKRNQHFLLQQGAIEYGREHYPFMVAMHTLFIVSLIAEYQWRDGTPINWLFLVIFIGLLLFKFWVISSLGKYWNTRIFRIPNFQPVTKGPFKYFKHPNYMEVICEIAIIPLVFHLYYTAVIFTLLNAAMLNVRIRVENRVWRGEL
ncbi:alkylpyrone methyltransferase [Mucilaginibacter gynuensis]|uniref:Alkylpyrone methyltransferase n=1 Tax=Mucilaginibacter gynuensis TaxID=1302236 RepID=A0ABP8G3B3_9SPHI